jgi:hypothetical protein
MEITGQKHRNPIESRCVASDVGSSNEESASPFEQAISALPELARNATERPEYFWQRQQAAIRSRIAVEEASKRPLTGFAWALGLALVLLASMLVRSNMAAPSNRAQTDPDQEMLMGIEHDLQNDVPEALEPAALLADEIGDGDQTSPARVRSLKEKRNAN